MNCTSAQAQRMQKRRTQSFSQEVFLLSTAQNVFIFQDLKRFYAAMELAILSGLAYNGRWEDGSIKWNGGANVKLRIFEKSSRFQHYVDSFNINTNAWVLNYVYKRLRFLNNRSYSQLGALVRLFCD